MTAHPYTALPDHRHWARAVAGPAAHDPALVDPVVRPAFRIARDARIATAGSCFAQHVARHLRRHGVNPFVTEPAHPLIPDVGCRNTVYNAQAQTGVEYVPEMRKLGLRHFRVELLRENAAETGRILDRYTRVLAGAEKPLETIRSLRVLNQLGVTRGTLVHE